MGNGRGGAGRTCEDRLRFSISTVDGRLAFTEIDIDSPDEDCRQRAADLREFLCGKPLEEIRHGDLGRFKCKRAGACFDAIVDALGRHIDFFRPAAAQDRQGSSEVGASPRAIGVRHGEEYARAPG
jgi:hypothetical protein